jgi:hypothetical protein
MWIVEISRQEDNAVIPDLFPLVHRGYCNNVAQQIRVLLQWWSSVVENPAVNCELIEI